MATMWLHRGAEQIGHADASSHADATGNNADATRRAGGRAKRAHRRRAARVKRANRRARF